MSYASWDPENGGSLVVAEIVPLDTIPIEALTLLPSGSTVDMLDIVPPKAAESNYGGTLTLLPDIPFISSNLYGFQVIRNGWYDVSVPYMRIQGLGTGIGTVYDINIIVQDGSGTFVSGDNKAIVANATSAFHTGLMTRCYLTTGITYRFVITFSQSATTIAPPDPPILLGGTAIWPNVYIFPVISGIDSFGTSNFVAFP